MRKLKRRIPVWAATAFCVALMLPLAAAVAPNDAARFLSQASLGADWDEIHHVADVGYEIWLEDQFTRPVGKQQPYLDERAGLGLELTAEHRRWAW